MEYFDARQKPHNVGKIIAALVLTTLCIFVLKQSHGFGGNSVFSRHKPRVTHVLVTGGAGYIGSHAALRLLKDNYRVTIVDNLSRGNMGAVKLLLMWERAHWNTLECICEAGRVVYILDQVCALENEMVLRLKKQGLDCLYSILMKKSAAIMLSGKKPIQAAVTLVGFEDVLENYEKSIQNVVADQLSCLQSLPFVTEKRQSVANRIREKYLDRIPGGFFVYDIFWVFFTPFMISVAKSFDAPIKLLFPTADAARPFSMLA
ncbi:unnamed protein product [Miscanthus lutarioriparius]|uniref:Uncharacterized protein n=1 Tax=Miscanthus lutarioriparius TaxID=422564 RepID=A0A811S4Y2_9POAL|nr:unnamed protein product [Miscanthus lutarioriparius]